MPSHDAGSCGPCLVTMPGHVDHAQSRCRVMWTMLNADPGAATAQGPSEWYYGWIPPLAALLGGATGGAVFLLMQKCVFVEATELVTSSSV